jgi:hypothetical protein
VHSEDVEEEEHQDKHVAEEDSLQDAREDVLQNQE